MFCNKRMKRSSFSSLSVNIESLPNGFPIAARKDICANSQPLSHSCTTFKLFKVTVHIKFKFKINLELVSFGSFGYLIVGLLLFVPDELRENMLDGTPSAVKWAET